MIDVIYKDEDVVVVNKPPGMVVHPDLYHKSGTLIQKVVKEYLEIKNVGDDPSRPGVVHRLDKDTSGAIAIARNENSFKHMKRLFKEKEITKKYLVLVSGIVKKDTGDIKIPIGRSRKDARRRTASSKSFGKIREAETKFVVVERFNKGAGFTLLEAEPITGRTHQIRSHFQAIGHPVSCDGLYGGGANRCPEGLDRQFLHAHKLEFISVSGKKVAIKAGMPDDLKSAVAGLRMD